MGQRVHFVFQLKITLQRIFKILLALLGFYVLNLDVFFEVVILLD